MEKTIISIYKTDNRYQMKLQYYNWELNIFFSQEEFFLLKDIRNANWNERKSIKAGKSASSHVFWIFDSGREIISILVGHDDETWDFGVFLPIKEFESSIKNEL